MIRTKNELMETTKSLMNGSTSEEVTGFIADLSDTLDTIGVNPSDYVAKSDFEDVQNKFFDISAKYDKLRSDYINRFYDNVGDNTIINAATSQKAIEEQEKKISYSDLFE